MYGQPANDQMTIIPKWSKGDVKRYQINHSSEAFSDKPEESSRETQQTSITVIAVKESGLDIVWKYEKANFIDSIPLDNPFKILMNTLSDNLIVKYTIKKNGTIKSINNYDEISKVIRTRVDSVIDKISKDPTSDQSKIPTIKFYFQMMFSTNSQIDEIVLNDIYKYHQLYGSTYFLNKPVSMDEQPITSTSSRKVNVVLKTVDQHTKTYRFNGEILIPGMEEMKSILTYQYSNGWLQEYTYSLEDNMRVRIKDKYSIKLIN